MEKNTNKKQAITNDNKKKSVVKKKTTSQTNQKFKERYFDYYDDVKHFTKGQEDW